MNLNQVKWAMQHDWFVSSYGNFDVCPILENATESYVVVAKEVVKLESDEIVECEMFFDDFAKLRAWAGY